MDAEAYHTLLNSLPGGAATLPAEPQKRMQTATSLRALKLPPEARLDIRLRELLGVGGMGSVHLAEQVALRRDVACKVPNEAGNERVRRAILREAWITGALEHPNIVPIYDVVTLVSGEPCVLMKRIEGVSWLECIEDPARMPRERRSDEPLAGAVEITIAICDAIEFAHSRNVLHRDVKPANVMLGAFGEVYLVDWGIAVAHGDRDVGSVRAPEAGPGISGTPAYMAPEMAKGDLGALGRWTDVYLLGATLHHALTGAAPHGGANTFECLLRAATSEVQTYEGLPADLAAILRRAMAVDPADRYPTAAALRDGLRDFLRHRHARRLQETAQERLAEALGLEPGDPRIGTRLTEARASFRQARALWADNEVAAAGFEKATLRLAEEELSRDNVAAAQALVADLDSPTPALQERVVALRARVEAQRVEVDSLRRLGADGNFSAGARARSFAAILFAAICFVNLTGLHFLRGPANSWSAREFVFGSVLTVLLAFAVVAAFWRTFRRNRANRSVAGALVVATGTVLVLRVLVALEGAVPFAATLAFEQLLYAVGFACVGLGNTHRMLVGAAAFAAGGVLGFLYPAYTVLVFAFSSATAVGSLAWVWNPRQRAR